LQGFYLSGLRAGHSPNARVPPPMPGS